MSPVRETGTVKATGKERLALGTIVTDSGIDEKSNQLLLES
jgi:hypothetical protein